MAAKDAHREKSSERRFREAMYRGLTRGVSALERTNDLITAERSDRREKPGDGVPRIGNVGDMQQCMEPNGQGGPGVALGVLMSLPGFAQEATAIPPVDETTEGLSGLYLDGTVICPCGAKTALRLGRVIGCEGECGRYFTGDAAKAFSFGPWPDELDGYEMVEHDGHDVPLLKRAA